MEDRERRKTIQHSHYAIESSCGIYADIAGYGKTLSMLGMLVRDKMSW